MTDELNQVQDANIDANNDENLFLDSVEDSTEDSSDENLFETEESKPADKVEKEVEVVDEKETTPVEEPTEATTEKPFLEIKYNKETKGLTQDEARELAQKGMNYDHINEKYNSLNESLDKLARLNGMDVNSYINSLNDTQMEYEVGKELEVLKEKYPNTDEEALKELATGRVKDRLNLQMQKIEDEKKSEADAQREAVERDVAQFEKEFPDVDIRNLPEEVKRIIQDDGLNLLSAYYKYLRNEDIKAKSIEAEKAKVDQINKTNKSKSLGNTTDAGGDEPNDFFAGLDSMI